MDFKVEETEVLVNGVPCVQCSIGLVELVTTRPELVEECHDIAKGVARSYLSMPDDDIKCCHGADKICFSVTEIKRSILDTVIPA